MQTVTIIKQDHFGRGIAYLDGTLVFVEQGLPQELIDITLVKKNKKFSLAKIEKIHQASSERVQVPCPYAASCGGCDLLHQSYEGQKKFKMKKIEEIMHKYAHLSKELLRPILASPPFHYRNKATLHRQGNHVGFYKDKSHEVCPIANCLLVDDKINRVMQKLSEWMEKNPGFDEAMIRISPKYNETMIALHGTQDQEQVLAFWRDQVDSLFYNGTCLFGTPVLHYDLLGKTFSVAPASFFQVNLFMTEVLYQVVIDMVKSVHAKKILDLYCGTGTISLLLSSYVDEVLGIEVVLDAVVDARRNQEENHIQNVQFICGKVEDHLDQITKTVDTVVVDPPRSGLDPSTIQSILQMQPKAIVYVSCDPMTLARDLSLLQKIYEVKELQPVDMFPNTHHVECVALLKLKE